MVASRPIPADPVNYTDDEQEQWEEDMEVEEDGNDERG